MAADEHDSVEDVDLLVASFEQDPVMAMVCWGPDHRIVAINRAARRSVPSRQALGLPYIEVTPQCRADGLEQIFDFVYLTGQPEVRFEWRTQRLLDDGTAATVYLDLEINPIRAADGPVVGISVRSADATERVAAKQAATVELKDLSDRFDVARDVVDTFQRALLPDRVPILPTVEVAARHLLAADEAVAGGDWFDVIERPGHVVLVVGDVVGHGVEAAVTMGQQRAVLIDRLADGSCITDAVAALDRRARRVPAAFGTTVCVADINTVSGAVEYITAGHPPPLLLGHNRTDDRFLAPSHTGALGNNSNVVAARDQLEPGATLVLYTDGLVELPHTTPQQGTLQLIHTARLAADNQLLPAAAAELSVERIASHTIETLTRTDGYTDDITILVAQRSTSPPNLHHELLADRDAAPLAQANTEQWLHRLGASITDTYVLAHATAELVQNTVDHAYPTNNTGIVTTDLRLDNDGSAVLTVTDRGRWQQPTQRPNRGLGLVLLRSLVDELVIDPTEHGTTTTVRHRISRPVGTLNAVGTHQPTPPPHHHFDIWQHLSGGRTIIGVSGNLDATTINELRTHLAIATAPGQPTPTLDLSEVTTLTSAAAHLILKARTTTPSLNIVAPPGTAAQHVLALLAVPHQHRLDTNDKPC